MGCFGFPPFKLLSSGYLFDCSMLLRAKEVNVFMLAQSLLEAYVFLHDTLF